MTIKNKMIWVIMLTCIAALLLAGMAFILWDWAVLRHAMAQTLSTQAAMIADNCKAAVAFKDAKDTEEILSALEAENAIVFGGVYTNNSELFASYYGGEADNRVQPSELQEESYSFGDGLLTVFKPVVLDGEVIGTVCLRSDLHPMYVMLKRNTKIIIAVLLLCSLVAYFVSSRLQRIISGPILSLAESAERIGKGNLNHRVKIQSKDELGQLAESFNNMAGKLKESYSHLEEKVRQRTAELTTANDQLNKEIDERKRAEQILKESEIKFRTIFENAGGALFIADTKTGEILDCNPQAEQLLGHTRDEIIGMHQSKIHPEGEEEIYKGRFAAHVQKGHTVDYEGEVQDKDGRRIAVWISAQSINIAGKDMILKLFMDISERKKAEEALWESQERYQSLVDNTLLGITVMDTNHKIIMTNATFTELFKKPAGYFVGKYCFREYEKREAVCPHCPGVRAMASGKTAEVETQAVLDNGTRIHVRNRAIPFFRQDGEVKGFIEIVENIDERKKAEQRQVELLKELKDANQELKDFAYIVSHDLKAPLRGINTLVNWISTDYADKLDENGKEQMNLLTNRVDRMHNLIDGILQYSRVGRVKGEKVKVNLNDLVSGVIDMVSPPENIAITIENELPVIKCEDTRIIQVFQNLLSNAVRYMDKPKGQIRIGCIEQDGFWKFSVADNGPGIEEKYFEKIFRIFQTLSPRDDVESTGVGLSVVKKIVELYGGKIWVESKIGEGSTFFFTLPIQEMGVKDAKLEADIACRR